MYVKIHGLDWFDNGLVNGMSIYMFVYITRRLTRLPVSGLTVVPCLDRNGIIVLFIVLCSSLFCDVQQCVCSLFMY